MDRTVGSRALLGAVCMAALACSDGDMSSDGQRGGNNPRPPGVTAGAGGAPAAGSGTGSAGTGFGNSPITMPPRTPPPRAGAGGIGTGEECRGVSETAKNQIQPVDIVIAIDQSGSMDEEIAFVQAQLNGFSQMIVDSGIDVRVILVATRPGAGGGRGDDDNHICVPPPLGGANCADNEPLFKQVDVRVESHDAWDKILEAYDQFAPSIRAESKKHVLVITDDTPEGVDGTGFSDGLRMRNPSFEGFVHHAIYAFTAPNELDCVFGGVTDICCNLAAGLGAAYGSLTMLTGGIAANLCEQNFEKVWAALATQVVQAADLSCNWPIPAPPAGEVFDAMKVNVAYSADGVASTPIGFVNDAAACATVAHGWYYDNNAAPANVLVCPQTCTAVEALMNPAVAIQFGCKRIEAPPE